MRFLAALGIPDPVKHRPPLRQMQLSAQAFLEADKPWPCDCREGDMQADHMAEIRGH